ncbi:MAG: 4Fe-4S dicluster domain-containing protein [Magnetococcales bacterium]|nr:4Fe-4S dicluster domain-containing protein [Magnetococcales bacterium]
MQTFLVDKGVIPGWIRGLTRAGSLFFPQRAGHAAWRFKPVNARSEIQFERYHPTIVPPGKQLAPTRETLFRYRKNAAGELEILPTLDESPRILAGIRPCDLKAIHLMDRVNRDGHGDPHYLTRRAHTTLIACDCLHPCDDACFCDATGALRWRDNADVFLTPLDGKFLVEVLSERGAALVAGVDFPACPDVAAHKAAAEKKRTKPFGRHFGVEVGRFAQLAAIKWQSPLWEKHVERCFSCGSCNLVCPTCYCFDVHDDFDLAATDTGVRTRAWDSCMLPTFAEVAGGHNFRPQPAARQRHRVKRKFDYLTDRFAEASFCVGCGRCGRQCTAGIDIFDIVNDLVSSAEARP